jgi:hypothetical protein
MVVHALKIPIIPALRRLRQEDLKFKARLGYIVRPSLQKAKQTGNKK